MSHDQAKRRKAALGDSLGTVQLAVEGVQALAEWAYQQTDADARRALPKVQAMLELVADRLRELHRVALGD